LSFPLIVFFVRGDGGLAAAGLAIFAVIAFRHSGNVKRLIMGQERKIGRRISAGKG
jgi:glycerol-3-phosphate acyltransferase PlsY